MAILRIRAAFCAFRVTLCGRPPRRLRVRSGPRGLEAADGGEVRVEEAVEAVRRRPTRQAAGHQPPEGVSVRAVGLQVRQQSPFHNAVAVTGVAKGLRVCGIQHGTERRNLGGGKLDWCFGSWGELILNLQVRCWERSARAYL